MWDVGVGLVEVGRFRNLDCPKNKDFYNRIFTPLEIKYRLSYRNPVQHFAATFEERNPSARRSMAAST